MQLSYHEQGRLKYVRLYIVDTKHCMVHIHIQYRVGRIHARCNCHYHGQGRLEYVQSYIVYIKHYMCMVYGVQYIHRAGQNRVHAPYMIVYLVISLPKIPYLYRIYIMKLCFRIQAR